MKIKRISVLAAFMLAFFLLTSCSHVSHGGIYATTVEGSSQDSSGQDEQPKPTNDGDIDIDLTSYSSTVVYAEVNAMVNSPEKYIGKKIKLSGKYSPGYYKETDKYYHYVVISDALACCQQGLEFVWNGEHTYPGDYPESGENIEITGIFGSYEELGVTYYVIFTDAINRIK